MKCPICNVDLSMSERQGIEIDYCPQCRGVWLDRGELDKIIERSAEVDRAPEYREDRKRGDDRYDYGDSYKKQKPAKKRRESFLSDLFEFGE